MLNPISTKSYPYLDNYLRYGLNLELQSVYFIMGVR